MVDYQPPQSLYTKFLKMKTFYITLLALILAPTLMFSQKLDVGLFVGAANYQGDINRTDILLLKETKPAFGIQAEYHMWDKIGIEANFVYGSISGDDENFDARRGLDDFGVSFESTFIEVLGKINYYPIRSRKLKVFDRDGEGFNHSVLEDNQNDIFDLNGNPIQKYRTVYVATDSLGNEWIYNTKGDYVVMDADRKVIEESYNKTWSPYMYAGAGLGIWDQEAMKNYETIVTDAGTQSLLPTVTVGGGVRFDFSKKFAVGLEGGIRYAFSDYLDGQSESRTAANADWYYVGGINFRYKLGTEQTIKF